MDGTANPNWDWAEVYSESVFGEGIRVERFKECVPTHWST